MFYNNFYITMHLSRITTINVFIIIMSQNVFTSRLKIIDKFKLLTVSIDQMCWQSPSPSSLLLHSHLIVCGNVSRIKIVGSIKESNLEFISYFRSSNRFVFIYSFCISWIYIIKHLLICGYTFSNIIKVCWYMLNHFEFLKNLWKIWLKVYFFKLKVQMNMYINYKLRYHLILFSKIFRLKKV